MTITSTRPLAAGEKRISWKWILHVGKDVPEDLSHIMGLREYSVEEKKKASEVVLLHREMDKATFALSPRASPYYHDLQTLVKQLTETGFLDAEGMITSMGRMVPSLVGCDDPLSLVVAWTNNLIPRDSEPMFAAGLSCFLQNRRNNQPDDTRNIYRPLCEIQERVTGADAELGSSMLEPMHMWIEGATVTQIVKACDSNPGHVCKTALRLSQLLEQLRDAGAKVGDADLSDICERTLSRCVRGLPFVPSTLLD